MFMHGDDCVAKHQDYAKQIPRKLNATDKVSAVARSAVGNRMLIPTAYCRMPIAEMRASRRPGGYAGGSPPDPIPNSVVKSPRADGTVS